MPRLGHPGGPLCLPLFICLTQLPSICLCATHLSVCVSLSHSLKTKKWVNEVR